MRDVSLAGHHGISSFGVPVYVGYIPGLCIPYSLPKSVMVMRAVSLERGLTALVSGAGGDAGWLTSGSEVFSDSLSEVA